MRLATGIGWFALVSSGSLCAQTARDAIRSFTGKQVILVRRGGEGKVKLERAKLDRLSGPCDVGVAVRAADLDKGRARFFLELIGTAELTTGRKTACRQIQDHIELEISGFGEDEAADPVEASLRLILPTPEQYLAANGTTFNLAPAPDDEMVALPPPELTHPRVLLRVDGSYTEEARKGHIRGSVIIQLTVGTDGRIHNARVVRGLGSGLDENALRALSLWRFEPGRQGDRVVASKARVEMNFHLL